MTYLVQQVLKKWLKLKQSRKPNICGIWGLRINRQVNNSHAVWKVDPFLIFWFALTFYCEMIVNKSVSQSNLSSINTESAHCFLNFLKNRSQFRCTGFLPTRKVAHLDGKNLISFIRNLVQNLMNLVLSSKSNRRWSENA